MMEQRESLDGDSIGESVLQGIALRRANLIAAAKALFQSVLSEQPRHADAVHQLGLVRTALGDFGGAIQLRGSAIELRLADPSWRKDLANPLCQGGDLTAGLAHCQKVFGVNPRLTECHHELGVALTRRSEIRQAHCHYQTVIALDLRAKGFATSASLSRN